MVIPLLYFALLQIGAPPMEPSSGLKSYRQEVSLLHLPIDRTALRSLAVWVPQSNELRESLPAELVDDAAPMIVLHAWTTSCQPCIKEFSVWRALGPELSNLHRGKVRIVHAAIQSSRETMPAFVNQMPDKLPFLGRYFDQSGRLFEQLNHALGPEPSLPITLLLDQQRVVRQAFVGPITERRKELSEATVRMMRVFNAEDKSAPPLRLRPVFCPHRNLTGPVPC